MLSAQTTTQQPSPCQKIWNPEPALMQSLHQIGQFPKMVHEQTDVIQECF